MPGENDGAAAGDQNHHPGEHTERQPVLVDMLFRYYFWYSMRWCGACLLWRRLCYVVSLLPVFRPAWLPCLWPVQACREPTLNLPRQ
jgi:hypothetical protein